MFEEILCEKFGDIEKFLQTPGWWPSSVEAAEKLLGDLDDIEVREIGRSAGDRPIIAAVWGEKEPLDTTSTSLHSSLAASVGKPNPTEIFPQSFYGKRRKHQVVVFQGAIHGTEFEGTVAALNLLNVLVRGEDLRGKRWGRLRKEATGMRVAVIPFANPDGRSRMPVMHFAGASEEFQQTVTMGLWKDGSIIQYPDHKRFYPIPLDKVLMLGSYFNDNGCNLQYDFCLPCRQTEIDALCQFYVAERPDIVISAHSNAGSLVMSPDPFIPVPFQHQQSRIGAAIRQRLLHEGHPGRRLSWVQLPSLGSPNFDQATSIYHCSGALPVVIEYPWGHPSNPENLDQILDMGLLIFEELLFFGNRDGFWPLSVWDEKKI